MNSYGLDKALWAICFVVFVSSSIYLISNYFTYYHPIKEVMELFIAMSLTLLLILVIKRKWFFGKSYKLKVFTEFIYFSKKKRSKLWVVCYIASYTKKQKYKVLTKNPAISWQKEVLYILEFEGYSCYSLGSDLERVEEIAIGCVDDEDERSCLFYIPVLKEMICKNNFKNS